MEIIIIVAVIIAAYLVYSIVREKGTGLDLNNDGKVDAADLKVLGTEAKAKVEEVTTKATAAVTKVADVDGDGKVTANDAKVAATKAKTAVKKTAAKAAVKKAQPKKKAVAKKKAAPKKK
jgi:hypothetical protein